MDSVHSHRAFAKELGGLNFPLLADFHPKGQVTTQYGLWREDRGTSWRGIVIIDREGLVRHSEVIPKGPPDVEQILAAVRTIAEQSETGRAEAQS